MKRLSFQAQRIRDAMVEGPDIDGVCRLCHERDVRLRGPFTTLCARCANAAVAVLLGELTARLP